MQQQLYPLLYQPAENSAAEKAGELRFGQIQSIADQAAEMGTLWILLSGGEPLLRPDFQDIYLYLKQKGFFVSVFTNAALINRDHVQLFKKYPPRDIEITIYGATKSTHKKVTGKDTFHQTERGIRLLADHRIGFNLKSMMMKSNVHEIEKIAAYCQKKTKRPFRFDPFLTLRLDKDLVKNRKIIKERLEKDQITALDKMDPQRLGAIQNQCGSPDIRNASQAASQTSPPPLFRCQAGHNSACIDSRGLFKLCSALVHPDFTYDLSKGSLKTAWNEFTPGMLQSAMTSSVLKKNCGTCHLVDLCMWCPAHADLETGKIEGFVQDFCDTAYYQYTHLKK